jgi:hypothetical protein
VLWSSKLGSTTFSLASWSPRSAGVRIAQLLVGPYFNLSFCLTWIATGSFLRMDSTSVTHSHLSEFEIWWRDHYNFLKDKGYKLRSRYSPDWVPSWMNTKKVDIECEDGIMPRVSGSIKQCCLATTHPLALFFARCTAHSWRCSRITQTYRRVPTPLRDRNWSLFL